MNLYIYGISANPPTLAHFKIIQHIANIAHINDDVWLVPSYDHPRKKFSVPFCHRFEMCRRSVATLPKVYTSSIEKVLRPQCSYELIKYLYPLYSTIYFVIDSHNFLELLQQQWSHSEEVLKMVTCVVINDMFPYHSDVRYINVDIDDTIRSTYVRSSLDVNQLSKLVLPSIKKYILKYGLYNYSNSYPIICTSVNPSLKDTVSVKTVSSEIITYPDDVYTIEK
jgi:nicotinic acid mononucleotide adenylyltransferase